MKFVAAAVTALVLGAAPANAGDAMVRVLSCKGPDAAMELYLPQTQVLGAAMMPVKMDGLYALDLSGALKGKHLEPVHVTLSPDRKFLSVDQYTRGLPVTKIAMAGGTVNFDDRFGTHAKCGPFGTR